MDSIGTQNFSSLPLSFRECTTDVLRFVLAITSLRYIIYNVCVSATKKVGPPPPVLACWKIMLACWKNYFARWENYFGWWENYLGRKENCFGRWENYFGREENCFGRWENYFGRKEKFFGRWKNLFWSPNNPIPSE